MIIPLSLGFGLPQLSHLFHDKDTVLISLLTSIEAGLWTYLLVWHLLHYIDKKQNEWIARVHKQLFPNYPKKHSDD